MLINFLINVITVQCIEYTFNKGDEVQLLNETVFKLSQHSYIKGDEFKCVIKAGSILMASDEMIQLTSDGFFTVSKMETPLDCKLKNQTLVFSLV